MTHLRKAMLEELQRRNLSPITTRIYLRAVEEFALYCQKPPDQASPDHVRSYQAHLFTDRKLSAVAVAQQLSALRFFYLHTVKGGTAHPGRRQPSASDLAAHAVCDRHAARGTGPSEDRRHRQQPHADPYSPGQRQEGSRCHPQPQAAR